MRSLLTEKLRELSNDGPDQDDIEYANGRIIVPTNWVFR
jgi:hypothetical protein